MQIGKCYVLIIWSLNPGKYTWFQALLLELSNEGYVWPRMEVSASSNYPLKNVAANGLRSPLESKKHTQGDET